LVFTFKPLRAATPVTTPIISPLSPLSRDGRIQIKLLVVLLGILLGITVRTVLLLLLLVAQPVFLFEQQ
jgi:hypothetical protein